MNSNNTLKPRLFGKITASASHEMQNILAIIKENAGLMDDLLIMAMREENDIPAERLVSCLSSIRNQVIRGTELTANLNGFAHTADHSLQKVDVTALIQRLLALTERIARNAGVELRLEPKKNDTALHLETDPLQLQVCLHLCLECLFMTAPTHTLITLALKGDKLLSAVEIAVSLNTQNTSTPIPDMTAALPSTAPWNELMQAVQDINARLTPTTSGIVIAFN